jgi:hypothetical protein
MRSVSIPGAFLAIALGCSTARPPAVEAPPAAASASAEAAQVAGPAAPATAAAEEWVDGKSQASDGDAARTDGAEEKKRPDYRTYRLGFWEFDLVALDLEPRGTTFRLLDLRIFRALEIGSGPDYHSFAIGEIPPLVTVFSTRHEEDTGELKLADVQAFAVALVRHVRGSESEVESHFLKLPVLGSFFGREREDVVERQHFLYVFRREVEH